MSFKQEMTIPSTAMHVVGNRRPRWRFSVGVLTLLLIGLFFRNFHGIGFVRPGSWQSKWHADDAGMISPAQVLEEEKDEHIAICMVAKDQSAELPEFLKHHYHHHGIRRFYVMDDGSYPPLSTFEYPIPKTAITFRYFAPNLRQDNMQSALYDACIYEFRNNHAWIALIDANEFIEVKGQNTLRGLLYELEKNDTVGALAINWQIHNSVNIMAQPSSIRKAFTKCVFDPREPSKGEVEDNTHVKSIVKTSAYQKSIDAHHFALQGQNRTIGEWGDVLNHGDGTRWPPSRERIALHRYAVKSREEFEAAISRNDKETQVKLTKHWNYIEGLDAIDCTEMASYDP